MPGVFISHSSQNAWLLPDLVDLIKRVRLNQEPFCSTEIPIEPGTNYKELIYEKLDSADFFVAIISQEYWKSRYCTLELGAAYHRYCFDENHKLTILPMLLPPLDRDSALAHTPLVELQIGNLSDAYAVSQFLQRVSVPDAAFDIDELEVRIAEFAARLHRHALEQVSLLASANVNVYYQEFPGSDIAKESVIICRIADNTQCLLEAHFSRLPYKPSFASLALEYQRTINLRDYLLFDSGATFAFDIDNIDGLLKGITVEFKHGPMHEIYHTVDCGVHPGKNSIAVPLPDMNKSPLENTNQICFVMHPNKEECMNAQDGIIVFSNIRVDFTVVNKLAVE